MTLEKLMKAFDYNIEGGSEHCWNCYPNSRYIDFSSSKTQSYGTLLHSTVNYTVYEATVYGELANGNVLGPYRWRDPAFIEANSKEYTERNIDENLAWDNQKWIDLEVEEDFLEKASAIFRGEGFDDRIQVPLDIEDDVFLRLALEAHKRDITVNQMVTEILQAELDAHKMMNEKVQSEDDRSTSDIEHSHYWYDTDRNR